jgi:hypothetical protein
VRTANHPVRAINWVKIIIGLPSDIINDRDFEQLTSITGSAPHSLLHLRTVHTHVRLDIISLILEDDVRVIADYLSYSTCDSNVIIDTIYRIYVIIILRSKS